MKRNCDNCSKVYQVDMRNYNRGWGRCCTKKCAAIKREKIKKGTFKKKISLKKQIDRILEY